MSKRGVTIYIGNLSYKREEAGIKNLFEEYGTVHAVNLIRDPKTGKSKGYAFVEMPKEHQAAYAVDHLNGKVLDDRTLKVSVASERAGVMSAAEKRKAKKETDEKKSAPKPESKRKAPKKKKMSGLDILFDNLNNRK